MSYHASRIAVVRTSLQLVHESSVPTHSCLAVVVVANAGRADLTLRSIIGGLGLGDIVGL